MTYLLLSLSVALHADSFRAPDTADWAGVWSTSYGDMHLTEIDEGVFDGYYGDPSMRVHGGVDPHDPGRLTGTWWYENTSSHGLISFQRTSETTFEGVWCYGSDEESPTWSGWNGTYQGFDLPSNEPHEGLPEAGSVTTIDQQDGPSLLSMVALLNAVLGVAAVSLRKPRWGRLIVMTLVALNVAVFMIAFTGMLEPQQEVQAPSVLPDQTYIESGSLPLIDQMSSESELP